MDFKKAAKELVGQMTYAEKMAQMKYDADAVERLGIPRYNWWNEALHGVARSGAAMVFPQAIAMAASFNPNLVQQDGKCSAVLQCFYPGAEGGNALADILFGKVSPSGRLPVTFYRSDSDLPDFEDYSMENRTYKFFKGSPLYPFGHGLTYSKISENWLDENTVELENQGEYDTAYSVLKFEHIPHKNLCGIKKVFIGKGEKITIKF